VSLVHANGVLGPAFRKEQVHVDGQVLRACCDNKAHGDLTVSDLAGAARVLPLDAWRLISLLEKSGVIDNRDVDSFLLRQLRQREPYGMPTYGEVIPP
jgi:hypothetical protein